MNYYTDVLKKYAVFSGRARRKEFWMFTLFNAIVIIVLAVLAGATGGGGGHMNPLFGTLYVLYVLAVLLPSLGVGIRRLHDTGRSGWWILISLVPLVGGIIAIIFYCLDSQPGTNAYGPNPKGNEFAAAGPATLI